MPLVEITMIEGRPPERLRALIHDVHEAVRRSLEAPPESIRVVIREVPPTHWAAGDVTIAERRAGTPTETGTGAETGTGTETWTATEATPATEVTPATEIVAGTPTATGTGTGTGTGAGTVPDGIGRAGD